MVLLNESWVVILKHISQSEASPRTDEEANFVEMLELLRKIQKHRVVRMVEVRSRACGWPETSSEIDVRQLHILEQG